jgi:hypothetical protein
MRACSPAPVTSTGSVGKAIRISWFIASDYRTEPKPVIRQVPVCQAAHPREARKRITRLVTLSSEPIRLRQNYHQTAIWR